jgi:hypothetical protein
MGAPRSRSSPSPPVAGGVRGIGGKPVEATDAESVIVPAQHFRVQAWPVNRTYLYSFFRKFAGEIGTGDKAPVVRP